LNGHLNAGRPFGVQVSLHLSWFAIALLILLSLGSRFREVHPDWSATAVWTTATVTALLFFVALLLHELSHALVARSRGLPVRSITLFALGGVAQIGKEASDPATEFWMGIAGPIASMAIGAACLGLAQALGWAPLTEPDAPALAALVWLGYINLSLALFNMIPAFPMDGGRVLRAAIWWMKGDEARATLLSARVGQVAAIGFIAVGALQFLTSGGFAGLWLAFIGWFLLSAVGATYGQLELKQRLRGVRVGDVVRDCPEVDGRINLEEFVKQHLLPSGGRCSVVTEKGAVAGLVTLDEVKAVPRGRWPYTTVDEVMVPLHRLRGVSPGAPLGESLDVLARDDVHQLPVVEDGRLIGVVSRGAILEYLRTRSRLQM
jgi:Zn-dependent protease/predicted transcriptional regulator